MPGLTAGAYEHSSSDDDAQASVNHRLNGNGGQAFPKKNGTAAPKLHAPLRRRRKTQISPDWSPTDEQVAWVKEQWTATDQQIRKQAAQFRDFHTGKGSLMADWSAAWRTWWRNEYHKIPRRPEAGPIDDNAKAARAAALEEQLARRRKMDEEGQ